MKTAIAIVNNKPHYVSAFAGILLLLMVAAYVYLLSLTVVHVVVRKEVHRDITALHSEISSLEAEYMTAQHRISTEIAKRTDLAATNDKVFLNKSGSSLVLSSRDN